MKLAQVFNRSGRKLLFISLAVLLCSVWTVTNLVNDLKAHEIEAMASFQELEEEAVQGLTTLIDPILSDYPDIQAAPEGQNPSWLYPDEQYITIRTLESDPQVEAPKVSSESEEMDSEAEESGLSLSFELSLAVAAIISIAALGVFGWFVSHNKTSTMRMYL